LEKSKKIVEIIEEICEWPSPKLGSPNQFTIQYASLNVHRYGGSIAHKKIGKCESKSIITHPIVKLKSCRATVPHLNFDSEFKNNRSLKNSSPEHAR